jgi:hypothetical protein
MAARARQDGGSKNGDASIKIKDQILGSCGDFGCGSDFLFYQQKLHDLR